MKKLILILLVLTAITESCKKYEDGPWISFRSPIKRLYGVYTLTKYTVNGMDSLSLYNDSLGLIIHCNSQHQNDSYIYFHFSGNKSGSSLGLIWTCFLSDKNKYINVYTEPAPGTPIGTGPFGVGKKPEWEILRLTNKELNMKTNYNGKEYYVELVEK